MILPLLPIDDRVSYKKKSPLFMVFEEKVHLFVSTHRPVDFLAFGVNTHPFGLSFTVLLFGLAMNC
jgi:hypothetical protein